MGDARLTPEAKAFVAKIDQDFFLRTGKRLHVNSGTRGPEAQAEAMFGKPVGTWRVYTDQTTVAEIRGAYERSRAAEADRAGQAKAMADVIRQQMAQGRYISNHLVFHAVDIRTFDFSPSERNVLKEASRRQGAKTILYEGTPPHLHVQF